MRKVYCITETRQEKWNTKKTHEIYDTAFFDQREAVIRITKMMKEAAARIKDELRKNGLYRFVSTVRTVEVDEEYSVHWLENPTKGSENPQPTPNKIIFRLQELSVFEFCEDPDSKELFGKLGMSAVGDSVV